MELRVMLSGMEILKKGRLLLEYPSVSGVYMELHEAVHDDFKTAIALKDKGKKIYFVLPAVFREKDRNKILDYMKLAKKYADGWMARQLELAILIRGIFPEDVLILDSSVYGMNRRAKSFLNHQLNAYMTAPVELNYSELKSLDCKDMELIVYGHQTLMISAQCIKKNHDGCTKHPEMIQLTDRQHKHFYVYNECDFCYNRIYNGLPTILFDKKKELLNLNPASVRIHFTMENERMMRRLLESYESIYFQQKPEKNILKDFTRGHFTRGIE